MLLLVTIGLVLAGVVLLVIGFVQDSLTYIFLSIACAAVAALALIVFGRLSRRRSLQVALDGGPGVGGGAPSLEAPSARGRAVEEPPAPVWAPPAGPGDTAPVPVPAADQDRVTDIGEPEPAPVGAAPPVTTAVTDRLEPVGAVRGSEPGEGGRGEGGLGGDGPGNGARGDADAWDEDEDWGDEVVFPIEDYDDLRVAEIIPLLPELEPDELEEVRDREVTGKNRSTILQRIDELLSGEVVPPPPAPAVPPAGRGAAPNAAAPASDFPIANYDELRVAEILPFLADLEAGELEAVRDREVETKERGTILARIDELLSRASAAEPAAVDSPPPPAAASEPEPGPQPAAAPARTRRSRDPLGDYDDLRVTEILPMLGTLDPEQLRSVRARESAGKNRVTILERVAELQREHARAARAQARTAVPAKAPAAKGTPKPAAPSPAAKRATTARKQTPVPVPTPRRSAPTKAVPGKAVPPKKATPQKATQKAAPQKAVSQKAVSQKAVSQKAVSQKAVPARRATKKSR